jgi:hypothetical protein
MADISDRGPMLRFLKYFRRKIWLLRIEIKKNNIILVVKKYFIRKVVKIVVLTLTPDWVKFWPLGCTYVFLDLKVLTNHMYIHMYILFTLCRFFGDFVRFLLY